MQSVGIEYTYLISRGPITEIFSAKEIDRRLRKS